MPKILETLIPFLSPLPLSLYLLCILPIRRFNAMESDDKIHSPHSPHSPATDSPDSPETNGRITVTVAAPAPATSPPQNNLALALPVQQPPAKSNGGGGGGREDCWSEGATAVLIEAWGERYLELSRGNLKQKHWKEVADIVSSREDYRKTPKTDIQCKNRIDTVKKKYKLEKSKISAGGGPSKWPFYDRLDRLIGPTAKISGSSGAGGGGGDAAASNSVVSSSRKVHLGIPVGIRGGAIRNSFPRKPPPQIRMKTPGQKVQLRKRRRPVDSDSSSPSEGESSPASPVSSDSLPPGTAYEAKRPRMARVVMNNSDAVDVETKGKGWGSAIRELTLAILKFGEAYEKAESSKIQQVVEMEKQRMKFTKEMELQRMQFFMKTQVELSQLKRGKKGGGGGDGSNANNNNINNHCDSDNLVRLD